MKLLLSAMLIAITDLALVLAPVIASFQSTTYTVKSLARTEQDLLPVLYKYLESLQEQHKILSAEIDKIFQESVATMSDLKLQTHVSASGAQAHAQHLKYFDSTDMAKECSSHPFKSYNLLQRFVNAWPKLGQIVTQVGTVDKAFKERLAVLEAEDKRGHGFPNKTHLEEAMTSLITLQKTYNLTVEELNGQDFFEPSEDLLKPQLCLEIGQFALAHWGYTIAIELFHFALQKTRIAELQDGAPNGESMDGTCQPLNPVELEMEAQLQAAIDQHDSKLVSGAFENTAGRKNIFHYQQVLGNPSSESFRNRVPFSVAPDPSTPVGSHTAYEMLCDNQQIRPTSHISSLVCKVEHDRNPYFALQPAKIEYFSYDPPLIQIHDMLTRAQVDRLLTSLEPHFTKKSGVVKEDVNSRYFGRTSSSVYVNDFDPRLQKTGSLFYGLTRRIEALTGLNVRERIAAEELQFANYGPGAFYGSHYDSSDPSTKSDEEMKRLVTFYEERGERIATFMIYLNDDFEGGNTAFPKLRMSVKPVSGSGVFWYNLRSDGSLDPLSLHAGCPVRYGSKTIANKWIRVNEQMFIRKCEANRGK